MTDVRPPADSIVSGAFWGRNPHGELRWLRENDPVYWDERGGVWAITKYDHVKEIESDPLTFSNAGGIRPETGPIPMMIDMDDPEHWMRRKLVNRGLHAQPGPPAGADDPRRCATRSSTRCASAASATSSWDIAAPLPMIVIGDMLGVEPEDRATLLRVVRRPGARARHRRPRAPREARSPRSPATPSTPPRVIADRRGCPTRRPHERARARRGRRRPPRRRLAPRTSRC